MRDHQRAMLAFLTLAQISHRKRQRLGRDRFLLLGAIEACRAGWLDVAARCREIVLADNRNHLIGTYETVPDALRSEDFTPFVRQLERFCHHEQAEHLLAEQNVTVSDTESDPGELALVILSEMADSDPPVTDRDS